MLWNLVASWWSQTKSHPSFSWTFFIRFLWIVVGVRRCIHTSCTQYMLWNLVASWWSQIKSHPWAHCASFSWTIFNLYTCFLRKLVGITFKQIYCNSIKTCSGPLPDHGGPNMSNYWPSFLSQADIDFFCPKLLLNYNIISNLIWQS